MKKFGKLEKKTDNRLTVSHEIVKTPFEVGKDMLHALVTARLTLHAIHLLQMCYKQRLLLF